MERIILDESKVHRCIDVRVFERLKQTRIIPFCSWGSDRRTMPRAKSNLREEEEKMEEEGGTFAEKGAVVNPRVSTSRFQSFPSLLGIEYSTDSNRRQRWQILTDFGKLARYSRTVKSLICKILLKNWHLLQIDDSIDHLTNNKFDRVRLEE